MPLLSMNEVFNRVASPTFVERATSNQLPLSRFTHVVDDETSNYTPETGGLILCLVPEGEVTRTLRLSTLVLPNPSTLLPACMGASNSAPVNPHKRGRDSLNRLGHKRRKYVTPVARRTRFTPISPEEQREQSPKVSGCLL